MTKAQRIAQIKQDMADFGISAQQIIQKSGYSDSWVYAVLKGKLAADMAVFLAAGGQIQQVQAVFDFYDPQGRVPVVGSTAYRVLIALYRNALTTPPKLKKGEVRVVNSGDLKQGDIIKGVGWLRSHGWKIEEIRFKSSAFIGYRLVR